MSSYLIKDDQGRITGRIDIPEPPATEEGAHDCASSCSLVTRDLVEIGEDSEIQPENFRHYIASGKQVRLRDQLEQNPEDKRRALADYADVAVVSQLPKGSEVEIEFNEHIVSHVDSVDDGRVRAVFSVPGRYVFKVDPFPHRAFEVVIDAVD